MKYSTSNMRVSLTTDLATFLRAAGYDIFWHLTGDIDTQTSGGSSRGTIDMTPRIPANPTYIRQLKTGETHTNLARYEVALPVLCLSLMESPDEQQIVGLGHEDFFFDREFRVDVLTATEIEQEYIHDLLFDWMGKGTKIITIYDYDTNPTSPSALEPVHQDWADLSMTELIDDQSNVRYYVRMIANVRYIE